MSDVIEEGGPRLFRGQYHVVSALDHQKLSFRNSGRKPIGLLEWLHAVVTGMDHQRRHIDLFQRSYRSHRPRSVSRHGGGEWFRSRAS